MGHSKSSAKAVVSLASSGTPTGSRQGSLRARLYSAPSRQHWPPSLSPPPALFAVAFVAVGPAGATAADPNPVTTGTVHVERRRDRHGHVGWKIWVGQDCAGRYGTGWAVDWWGISTSATPSPNFNLTDASEVVYPGTSTTTGTVSPFGVSIGNLSGGRFFHVGQYYAGETVNSSTTCTDELVGGKASSTAPWSATATYPSFADIPAQMCVNMYDEHGKEGQQSGSATDFSPSQNGDNSIQTNDFDPSGGTFCLNSTTTATQLEFVVDHPGLGRVRDRRRIGDRELVCWFAREAASISTSADRPSVTLCALRPPTPVERPRCPPLPTPASCPLAPRRPLHAGSGRHLLRRGCLPPDRELQITESLRDNVACAGIKPIPKSASRLPRPLLGLGHHGRRVGRPRCEREHL